MASGFKIADAFVEAHLDRDPLRSEINGLPAEINADVDRAGKDVGERLGKGIGDGIGDGLGKAPLDEPARTKGTSVGGKFSDAFSDRVKAALKALPPADIELNDEYAEAKLEYLRDELTKLGSAKIGVDVSDVEAIAQLTELREQLEMLRAASPSIQVKTDTAAASAEIDRFLAATEVKVEAAGQQSGDKLADGMRTSIIRNSPLIAAALAGGLTLGGPALAAGTVGLLGVIAATIAARSPVVKTAFGNLWASIKTDLDGEASQLAPTFAAIAGMLGASFQRIQPTLHTALQGVAPELTTVTGGVTSAVESIVSAISRLAQGAGPIVSGLTSLIRETGEGVAGLLDQVTAHAPAVGTVLSSVGSLLGALLPMIGQLVGIGAELGAEVLPPVAAALHLVAAGLQLISPILPAVVAGFTGLMAAKALAGVLNSVSQGFTVAAQGLAYFSYSGAPAAGVAGKLSTATDGASKAVSGIAAGLPVLGAVLAVVGSQMEQTTSQTNTWAQALLDGGKAAANVKQEYLDQFGGEQPDWLGQAAMALGFASSLDDVSAKAKQLYDAMSPLQQRQQDVTKATNDLQLAVEKYGPSSDQASSASATLYQKQQALTTVQQQLEQATHGVTQAILDEADQALAAADSGLAYRQAQNQAAKAAADFAQALREHKATLNDNSDASLTYEQALLRQAEAAGKAAADQSGLTDKMQLQQKSDQATLAELYVLRNEYGTNFPASLQQTIDRLEHTGVALDAVGQQHPDPTVTVNDQTGAPIRGIHDSLVGLGATRTTPPVGIIDLTPGPVRAIHDSLIGLASQRPTPVAGLNPGPFNATNGQLLGQIWNLGSQRPTPTAGLFDLATGPLRSIKAAIDSLYSKTITVTTRHVDIGVSGRGTAGLATGGRVGDAVALMGKRFDVGGKISGPGGGTDDMVPAVTYAGDPLRVSNDEWIVPERPSLAYGDQKMAAIVAGTATVLLPSARRLADGGRSGSSVGLVAAPAAAGGSTVTVQTMTLSFPGVTTIADPALPRQLLVAIRAGLVKLERESR